MTETWLTSENLQVNKNKIDNKYHVLSATRSEKSGGDAQDPKQGEAKKHDKAGGGVAILIAKSYANCVAPLKPLPLPKPPYTVRPNDKPLSIDIKLAKFKVTQLPWGFPSVVAVSVYSAEFGRDAARQRRVIWRIVNMVEQATKCSSIGNPPLVFIAGDFNGGDLSPLCNSLKLYKLNQFATHKKGAVLDQIFSNAPRCYVTEILSPLVSYTGVESDLSTPVALLGQAPATRD